MFFVPKKWTYGIPNILDFNCGLQRGGRGGGGGRKGIKEVEADSELIKWQMSNSFGSLLDANSK